MGRKRKHNPNIPSHIDQAKIPTGCYFDSTRKKGHWYTIYKNEIGQQKRKRIAGERALMSDLHKAMEEHQGIERNNFDHIAKVYIESHDFKKLMPKTQRDYRHQHKVLQTHMTKLRKPIAFIPLSYWTPPLVQKLIDTIGTTRGPSAARHLLTFIRRVFSWNRLRGNCTTNPATGVERPTERKKQTLPTNTAYYALLNHAIKNGTHGQKHKGSCAHYIWQVMELEYLCRLRGAEVREYTDANVTKEGLVVMRRKGSKGNLTKMNTRLQKVIDHCQTIRQEIYDNKNIPVPMRPEDRPLIVNTLGEPLKESAYHSAWQRFITGAIKQGIIEPSQRFSLHDLKRKGITDTHGDKESKKNAGGHTSDTMLDVYDKSIPEVNPSAE